jgi:hypothetical protein
MKAFSPTQVRTRCAAPRSQPALGASVTFVLDPGRSLIFRSVISGAGLAPRPCGRRAPPEAGRFQISLRSGPHSDAGGIADLNPDPTRTVLADDQPIAVMLVDPIGAGGQFWSFNRLSGDNEPGRKALDPQ